MKHKQIRQLTKGEIRRVSIAEEIVHGPSLLLIDEPNTGLDVSDESVMMMTFREMVNQDKTVITTIQQPTNSSFELFDTILLLSHGRVIYHGPANNAVKYFLSNPFTYDFTPYAANPGDFLLDISGLTITDSKQEVLESSVLEANYKNSEIYRAIASRLKKSLNQIQLLQNNTSVSSISPVKSGTSNPLLGMSPNDLNGGGPSMHSFDLDNTSVNESGTSIQPAHAIPSIFATIRVVLRETFVWSWHDMIDVFFKSKIVLHRSFLSLFYRWKLTGGSMLLYLLLACVFGWIIGDCSAEIYNSTSFFAVGSLILLICNVQHIYYLYRTNEVS